MPVLSQPGCRSTYNILGSNQAARSAFTIRINRIGVAIRDLRQLGRKTVKRRKLYSITPGSKIAGDDGRKTDWPDKFGLEPADEFFNFYSHGFIRVGVGVPALRVADPEFNSSQ